MLSPAARRRARSRPLAGRTLALLLLSAFGSWSLPGLANSGQAGAASARAPRHAARLIEDPSLGRRVGRPNIRLNKLELPQVPGQAGLARYLRRTLAHEARKLDWGAGQGAHVEYRFVVASLTVLEKSNVVTVSCTARGYLPGGRRARSRLTFGGDPKARASVIRKVLEIVARGVLTRLAELERNRRGIAPLE